MNYPNKKTIISKKANKTNLGMTLESDLDLTNKYYLNENIAVIYKKPTPVQVVNVSYPARNKAKITEAYYKTPSTTDYNGIYKGRYLDFDAKETNSKTAFPLRNIPKHQINHLRAITEHGGIGFLIINFKAFDEYFLITAKVLLNYWDNQHVERKSIPYKDFLEKTHQIKFAFKPRLDYLKIIDQLYFD